MKNTSHRAFNISIALALLLAAWVSSANMCPQGSGDLRCGPITTAALVSMDALFLPASAKVTTPAKPEANIDTGVARRSQGSQSASLLLLGAGFALAAQGFKGSKRRNQGD